MKQKGVIQFRKNVKKATHTVKEKEVIRKFFDFYSIVELYLRTGGFRDNPNYKDYPVFVSWRSEEKIRQAYEDIVNSFYEDVHNALTRSVKSELRHFYSNSWGVDKIKMTIKELINGPVLRVEDDREGNYKLIHVTPGKYLKKEFNISTSSLREARKYPDKYPHTAHIIFTKLTWSSEYGGKMWAKGAALLMNALTVRTFEDKIYWIDRVLDLYHNNGHMINKTEFRCLSDKNYIEYNGKSKYTTYLNLRARSKSILDFITWNSSRVKKLVLPKKNILTIKH